MPVSTAATSTLLIIDFQARLMPAIDDAAHAVRNAKRLLDAATLLNIPSVLTEQNPKGLGGTVDDIPVAQCGTRIEKMSFDSTKAPGFFEAIDKARSHLIVAGCEAHVCVLQTVLGALAAGHKVSVVQDAIGSRREESKRAAIARMAKHGADIVTTEMVIFEWIGDATHPKFRECVALIK